MFVAVRIDIMIETLADISVVSMIGLVANICVELSADVDINALMAAVNNVVFIAVPASSEERFLVC